MAMNDLHCLRVAFLEPDYLEPVLRFWFWAVCKSRPNGRLNSSASSSCLVPPSVSVKNSFKNWFLRTGVPGVAFPQRQANEASLGRISLLCRYVCFQLAWFLSGACELPHGPEDANNAAGGSLVRLLISVHFLRAVTNVCVLVSSCCHKKIP